MDPHAIGHGVEVLVHHLLVDLEVLFHGGLKWREKRVLLLNVVSRAIVNILLVGLLCQHFFVSLGPSSLA